MPTYIYKCETHGEFEVEHSINDKLEECPHCKAEGKEGVTVERLISGGSNFILQGSGWASTGYS